MGKTAQAHTTAGQVQGAGPRPGQNLALLSSDETPKRTSRWPQIPKERNGAAVWYWESGQLDFRGWREEIQASPDPPLEP